MPPEALAAVLLSALIHAGWNAALKAGRDRLADGALLTLGGLPVALAMIAFSPPIAPQALAFLAGSVFVHVLYWRLLIASLDAGDLGHVYTVMRGTPPVFIAFGAFAAAGEVPSAEGAAGIALVVAGLFAVGFSPGAAPRATALALLTAVTIAGYTLIDALGARAAGSAPAYVGWLFIGQAGFVVANALYERGPAAVLASARAHWPRHMIGGAAATSGYTLSVFAQTIAPIAYVSAVRESSVVFAALIAGFVLKEAVGPRRWAGAVLVGAGAAVIALAR